MILRLLPLLFIVTACTLPPPGKSAKEQYFLTQVKPVLQQNCVKCHNGSLLPPPALNLTTKSTAFKRSATGRHYLLPRDPDGSLLISAVQRGGTHPKMMPRAVVSLTEDQIGMLREWIEDGAYWPEDAGGTLRPQKNPENP